MSCVVKNVEKLDSLTQCWWVSKFMQLTFKTIGQDLLKLTIHKLHNPQFQLIPVVTKEISLFYANYVHAKTYVHILIAALGVIAKNWKQSNVSQLEAKISQLWYIDTMECYLAIN